VKSANKLRLELANGQRMKKTQAKWLEWCEQHKERITVTGNNAISIGDKVDYTITRSNGYGCFTVSARSGIVFAFNDSGSVMMVVSSGYLRRVSNKIKEEEQDDE